MASLDRYAQLSKLERAARLQGVTGTTQEIATVRARLSLCVDIDCSSEPALQDQPSLCVDCTQGLWDCYRELERDGSCHTCDQLRPYSPCALRGHSWTESACGVGRQWIPGVNAQHGQIYELQLCRWCLLARLFVGKLRREYNGWLYAWLSSGGSVIFTAKPDGTRRYERSQDDCFSQDLPLFQDGVAAVLTDDVRKLPYDGTAYQKLRTQLLAPKQSGRTDVGAPASQDHYPRKEVQ